MSSSSNTYQKQNLALCLFYEAETSIFRRIFIQKPLKSSLEVRVPLSRGKRLCSPWVGLDQTKAAPKIFLMSVFLHHWPAALLWPLPPHLAALQGWRHPKATTTCPTCGSWASNTPEPGLRNSNAAWAGARWPDSASLGMGLELWTQIWTWILGLDPRVRAGPHL